MKLAPSIRVHRESRVSRERFQISIDGIFYRISKKHRNVKLPIAEMCPHNACTVMIHLEEAGGQACHVFTHSAVLLFWRPLLLFYTLRATLFFLAHNVPCLRPIPGAMQDNESSHFFSRCICRSGLGRTHFNSHPDCASFSYLQLRSLS